MEEDEQQQRHISFNLDDRQDDEEDLLAPAGGMQIESYGFYLESIDDQNPIEQIPSSQTNGNNFKNRLLQTDSFSNVY